MKNFVDIGTRYAEDVVSGDIVACVYVKQSCQRYLDDLEREGFEWHLCHKRANHVCNWLEHAIRHVTGPLANEFLKLEPWQVFQLINMYGWVDETKKVRRFQYVILQVARKNGKSLFASGLALYEMIFGEEGGQVYSLATKSDQAKICWDDAIQMYQRSHPDVRSGFKHTVSALTYTEKWSRYRPLGRDSKSLDGLNPTFCIYDEAAAYSDRNIVEVMTSATGARDNFLHLFITTAQFSRTTVYFENMMYLSNILSGRIQNDRWFGSIYTLDEGDDWTDESVWIKANPNLDVSVKKGWLRDQVMEATQMQSKRNSVLVKHMNIFTTAEANWLDLGEWDRCKTDSLKKDGDFYVAMDLSATRDLTALCYLWNAGDEFHVDFQCFLPRKSMENVPVHLLPIYRGAIERGSLSLTEGDVVDYREVMDTILDMSRNNRLKMIGYDKYNANLLVSELEDKRLPTMDIAQGITALSPAAKETERLIVEQLIRHTDDPFIAWQLENCAVYTDKNDNIKITKGEDQSLKIDAIIAMIMAVSMAAGSLETKGEFNLIVMEL